MITLYENILKSTGSGGFKFSDKILVNVGEKNKFCTQFDIAKLREDFCDDRNVYHGVSNDAKYIWEALCNMPIKFTEKEVKKALVHHFDWYGPEDGFFKQIFKGYLINEDKFDFYAGDDEQLDMKTITIGTHEKYSPYTSRFLFTIKL